MALPLPTAEQLFPAGGQLARAWGGLNALTQSNLENKLKRIEAQYKPLTTQAEAASKLAYANLMGPQFLAKLFNNPDFVANLSEQQRQGGAQTLFGAGSGKGTGANALNNMNFNIPQQEDTLAGWAVNALKNKLMGGSKQATSSQSPVNAMLQGAGSQGQGIQNQGADSGMSFDKNGNNVVASPQEVDQAVARATGEKPAYSADNYEVVPEVGTGAEPSPKAKKGYFEKSGEELGKKEEGKEAGKLRAKDIDQLGKTYEKTLNLGTAYDRLAKLATNPTFQKLKSENPLFQSAQLSALKKIGTPQEQKMIGDFITSSQEVVRDTINSFEGQKMKGEVTVAKNMKVDPEDTWNVMVGKLEAGMAFNEFVKRRTALTSKIMKNQHVDKQEALEQADNQLNGDTIRKQVEKKLTPKPTDRDIEHMMQKYNIPREEVEKRLKAKGII